MNKKLFRFLVLPLLMATLLSIAYSAFKENEGGLDWDWNMGKLFDFSSSIFSTDTIYFTPDQWNKKDHGWQLYIDSEELKTHKIKVSSSYEQCFLRKTKTGWTKKVWRPIFPSGRTWRDWPSAEYRRHLPLRNRKPGMVIAKADGKIIPVGYGRKITAKTIYLGINVPQNWAEVPGKTPADNFKHNRGSMRVTIEKDWAIFEKIAGIFKSLGQYFKG